MREIRRKEKAITSEEEMKAILIKTKYITIGLCKNNKPYLVTVSHGFDPIRNVIYFHCADEGKKVDYINSNPNIWGQAIIDLGYASGECNHHYESVQFSGKVEFVDDPQEKEYGLTVMINQLEKPELKQKVLNEQITEKAIKRVTIGKIIHLVLSGKKG